MATKTKRKAKPSSKRRARVQPAQHEGMGAVPYEDGVAFRVWAPHAEAVRVAGNFNDWSADAAPLAAEEKGYWSADIPDAKVGDEYQFVIVYEGEAHFRVDPYARQVTHSNGNAVVYDDAAFDWGDDGFTLPPFNELVLYELHVGTFHDKNQLDDKPGTLQESIDRLDYLRDLGINAVCLMPLMEFPGDYSWGYNPAHPFAVETSYGGPDALKRFVKEAHARGIGVILDVVYNHFGPSDIDLWRFDGWGEDEGGGIYFYNDHRADTPWGHTRPDYGREEVRRYIRDNALMWLTSFRADGLRWDGTVFVRRTSFDGGDNLPDGWQMMQEINAEVRERMPGKLLIAEDLQRDEAVVTPPEHGGAGFHAQWDTEFVYPLREQVLITHDDSARDLDAAVHALTNRYGLDAFSRVIYVESHDNAANGGKRLACEIDEGDPQGWAAKKRVALASALTLTAPGLPMLFQGQEFLEDDWFADTDPLDWDLTQTHEGLVRLHRDLIRLRRNADGTTRGLTGAHLDVFHVNPHDKVIAFRRGYDGGPGDDTVVIVNLINRSHEGYRLGFPSEGRWRVRFNSDWEGYSDAFGGHPTYDVDAHGEGYDGLPASGEISFGPYTVVILSQD